MKILALDTSTRWLSVALYDGAQASALRDCVDTAASQRILPAIDEILTRDGTPLASVEGVAFGAGPGAFTGVRIACGVAQGLAFGVERPVFAVATLEALAQSAWRQHGWERVVACLDARMHEVYVAAYQRDRNGWTVIREPAVDKPDAFAPFDGGWHGAGDGFLAHPALAQRLALAACDGAIIPDAQSVAECAWPRVLARAGVPAHEAQPLYVRHRVALTSAERAAGIRL
jgi:tRNA threonylcarbamoyladenosine biosynthesis protein TsaB